MNGATVGMVVGLLLGFVLAFEGVRVLARRFSSGACFIGAAMAALPAFFLAIVVGGTGGGSYGESLLGNAGVGLAVGIAVVFTVVTLLGGLLGGLGDRWVKWALTRRST